jgi:alkanesulfonate monooxygenase SsuD/methylene tetrahydromethanopterin reductase-like flavin-dependent oxidoreductase (luciferase family)
MPTFGIMHDFRPRDGDGHARYFAESLDEVALADRLGLDAVWLSEHHLTHDGVTPAPLVLAAAIAARTSRIRIGTSVLVLPLHHPLRVAEEAAVLDLLPGGTARGCSRKVWRRSGRCCRPGVLVSTR